MAGTVANYFKKLTNTSRDVTELELTNIGRVMLTVDNWQAFRDWINGVGNLINEQHLGKLWDGGYIVGFLGKEEAAEALKGEDAGVFLIRFLDFESGQSEPGIIIDYSTEKDSAEINSIVITAEELKSENLPERIQNMDFLHYVYSGHGNDNTSQVKDGLTEKEIAFPTTTTDTIDGEDGDEEHGITMFTKADQHTPEMIEKLQVEFESFLKEVLVETKDE